MSIWKRALLWVKIKDTLAIGSILSQAGMEIGNTSEALKLWIGLGSLVGYLVGMWMEDKDKDGIVDLFQTEVTTKHKITSESPIEVETTKTIETPKQ